MEDPCYWKRETGYVAFNGHLLYVICSIDGCLPGYGHTPVELHRDSYFRCFQSYGPIVNLHAGSYVWWLHWKYCGGQTGVCILGVCL